MNISPKETARLINALPFWISLTLLPVAWIGAIWGGWLVFLLPLVTWYLFSFLDMILGLNLENLDTETKDSALFWYRLITIIWPALQFFTLFGILYYITHTSHLALWEELQLFFGIGILCGAIGINYSHELMHQKNWFERFLGDSLLGMVLYSHFRSEHLLVHHRYVGTPRDSVSARKGEGYYAFLIRVLPGSFRSALRAEKEMLARKGLSPFHRSNPFWKYMLWQTFFLVTAYVIGGGYGVLLFAFQSFVAIAQLELVNYIEHYGLTRKYLGNGKYEHVLPRHSWNAAHKASNWLLINLQRHSDHHYKPSRRFPLLQNYTQDEAPQLPYGYSVIGAMALIPPLYKKIMHPKLKLWRKTFYPEISDWTPYNNGGTQP